MRQLIVKLDVSDGFGNKKVLIYFAKSLICNKKDFYPNYDKLLLAYKKYYKRER